MSDKLDLILKKLDGMEEKMISLESEISEIKSEIKRLDQKMDVGFQDLHDSQVVILKKIQTIEKQIEHLSFRSVEHEREIRELKTAK